MIVPALVQERRVNCGSLYGECSGRGMKLPYLASGRQGIPVQPRFVKGRVGGVVHGAVEDTPRDIALISGSAEVELVTVLALSKAGKKVALLPIAIRVLKPYMRLLVVLGGVQVDEAICCLVMCRAADGPCGQADYSS